MSQLPRVYIEDALVVNAELVLEGALHKRLSTVMRMRVDDALLLFNGDGYDYAAKVAAIEKKSLHLKIDAKQAALAAASPCHIHLGQVLSRGERMDYALQKSVELGVAEITPLISERCGVKLSADRMQKRMDHWQKVMVSASEQCDRADVPKLNPVMMLDGWVAAQSAALCLVCHPVSDNAGVVWPLQADHVAVLIGSEGGLTEEEARLCTSRSFQLWQMGARVLRTETAPVVALSALQIRYGDMLG